MIESIVANSAPAGRTLDQLITEIQSRAEAQNHPQSMTVPVVAPPPAGVVMPAGGGLMVPARAGLAISPTFGEIADRYVHEVIEIKYGVGFNRAAKSALQLDINPILADIPIFQIRRQDIRALLKEVLQKTNRRYPNRQGCPAKANWIYWFLGRFFIWCLDENILDATPMYRVARPGPISERERVLNDDEIRLFWQATAPGVEMEPFGMIARLLLLTAQRRSEIADIEHTQIDREARMISIPILKTKSRRPHLVPISNFAFELLDSVPWAQARSLVFSRNGTTPLGKMAFRRANVRIHKRMVELSRAEKVRDGRNPDEANIPWFVLHDLRRTAATVMCRLGHPVEVVDKVLNHAGGMIGSSTTRSVVKVYIRHEFLSERGEALQALANHIKKLIGV
jgi:integrase